MTLGGSRETTNAGTRQRGLSWLNWRECNHVCFLSMVPDMNGFFFFTRFTATSQFARRKWSKHYLYILCRANLSPDLLRWPFSFPPRVDHLSVFTSVFRFLSLGQLATAPWHFAATLEQQVPMHGWGKETVRSAHRSSDREIIVTVSAPRATFLTRGNKCLSQLQDMVEGKRQH